MPDLKQALRDFVATSNSGKYADENVLLSKFPELKGYDINTLKDFVATSNSGKYKTEDELFSKFPEFSNPPLKKKDPTSASNLGAISSESPKPVSPNGITPKPEEKKFKYDEASFSKMVKGMQEYQQGKTKNIQDFADPRLNKTWNEIKDKQSKNYNDPIGNFSSAVIQKASDLVPKRVSDAWNKGLLQGEQANIVNLGFEEMTDEDVNRLSRIEQELGTYTPSKEEQKFAEGGFSWVINNPVDGAKFIGETILNSLASQIKASTRSIPQGVAVGAAAGAPIGGVGAIPGAFAGATAGTIMAGLNIETSQKILQSIKDAGFDLKNPEDIRKAFSDRDMIEKFRISGLKRGVPIAIIDVFTAGIAGKVAKGGSTLARSAGRKAGGLAVEGTLGAFGEFTAQVASGEKIDPNAIVLEGIAEVGAGAPTLVTSTAYQGALERKNTSSSDKNIALQITANKVAGDEDARNHLKKLLSEGTIDEIEFKDGIKVIEESKVSNARIPDNIVGEARAESIVLMNRKTDVQNQIRELEGKKNMMDEVYHPEIDQQIEVLTKKTQEIDNELINTQKQNDAIQKQTTDEGVLRTEQPQVGLQEVGEGDQVNQVITEEAKPKEEVEPNSEKFFNEMDIIFPNDSFLGGYAATDSEGKLLGRILMSKVDDNTVKIDEIVSDKRGQRTGNGSAIMRIVTENADKNNIKLTLIPNLILQMKAKGFETPQKLESFYKKFGFVKSKNGGMVRLPIEVATEVVEQTPTPTKTVEQEVAELNSMLQKNKPLKAQSQEIFDNVVKSVKTAFPDLFIQSFDTVAEMKDFAQKEYGNTISEVILGDEGGIIIYNRDNKPVAILTNLEGGDVTTMPHEAWHAILIRAFGDNQKLFTEFRDSVNNILRENGYGQIADDLEVFANTKEYIESGTQAEEWLVQLGGMLTASGIKSDSLNNKSKTLLTKLKDLINQFAERILGEPVFLKNATPEDVLDFMVAISDRMSRGESIADFFEKQEKKKPTNEFKKLTNEFKKISKQIIGENANLSATVRRYLDIAKKMEEEGIDELAIRIATGWERGFGGKWRYEIPYGKIKDIDLEDLKTEVDDETGKENPVAKLSDIFSAPDLYNAYNKDKIGNKVGAVTYYTNLPKVADLKVVFKKLKPNEMGAFSRIDSEIVINRDEFIKNKDEMQLTIIHEIQHYIQEVERFEKGSNPSFALWKSKQTLNELRDNIKQLKSRYENIKIYFPNDIDSLKEQKEFIKKATETYKEFKTKISFLAGKSPKNIEDTYRSPAFDLYFRTAGEVEARLAEDRSKLSASERRKTLLKDTVKDVAPEDQIFYDEKEDVERLKAKLQRGAKLTEKDIIKVGLANGFSNEAIRTVLQGRGFTEEQINNAFDTTKEAAKKVEVTPEFAKGYKELKGKLEKEFSNYIKLVDDKDKGLKFIMTQLKKSDVYRNATDVQKEKMVRDIRAIAGKKEKSAPSVDKLFGNIKDVTKITMTEKQAFAQQMKSENRGGKDAKKAWMKKSAELTKSIKTLADSGKITVKQAAAVLRKFSGVNLFDDASIDRFVEYMSKVFNNAEYAEKISNAFAKLPTAKKNAKTKIGIAESLTPSLNRMLSIKPTLIPDAVLDSYLDIVDMIGKKAEVLTLEEINSLTKRVNDILDAVDTEVSKADELAERFNEYQDKVLDEDGKLDYSATIKAMLKDNTISDDEAEIMRKYKSSIVEPVERVKKTEEELAAEKEELISAVESLDVDTETLPTRDERDLAKELASLIKTDAIKELTNNQLKNLFKTIDNINNGYLPHYAQLMVEKLNAINNAKTLSSGIQNASPLSFSKLYANLKSIITRKGSVLEMIRRNPLAVIDQVFGNFKDKPIFNSLFEKSAEAETKYKSDVTKVQQKLSDAQEAVAKSFNNDANKTLMSSFKMMTYMIQLEHDSNINSKQVNQASDYLKATIKHIDEGKSEFGERDANMLQDIVDKYTNEEGQIDIDKLYKSFNDAEKNAIKTVRDINESLTEKAVYTASIIRGDKIAPLNNYVHLNVLNESLPQDNIAGVSSMEQYNQSIMPSSKAKSLIERTGKVSPLNFNIFTSANRGANFVLMDYHLTEPIRTARKTINETTAMLEKDGRMSKKDRELLNAVKDAYEEVVSNVLTNNFINTSIADDVMDFMTRQGYRAVLASAPRFVSELSSNISYALLAEPKAFQKGIELRGVAMSPNAVDIMNNVDSKQTTRIFHGDTLSGRLIDTSTLNQVSGVRGGKGKSDVANKTQQIYNNSLKKYKNFVELTADALISTPDKMVMRPIWFGSFANEFENVTGSKPDFDKIAANDEAYMSENKEAIDKARNSADDKTVRAGATENAFMGILKGTVKPNQSALLRGFNIFNNFMTRFMIYEYVTARAGINAAMGNGSVSRKQGVALIAGVTSRMLVYSIMTQMLGSAMVGLITGDDDEEDDKTFLQKIGQYITSTATGLILGRDYGNATKSMINFGVEKMNEKYLDFLREGEYDPYQDAIQYTMLPTDSKKSQTDLGDLLMKVGGALGPSMKTADLIIKKATGEPKQEAEAIERSNREIKQRIPLEVLGNTGFIPLYKDVRKILMSDMYKELRQTKGPTKKDAEQELLQGYDTREDMKRYDPTLYEQTFGKGSPTYEVDKMIKDMEKQEKDMEQKIKDMTYGYTGETKKKK